MQQFVDNFRMAQLLLKRLKNELNESEKTELEAWLSASPMNNDLLEMMENEARLREELSFFESVNVEKDLKRVKSNLNQENKVISLNRPTRKLWWAAAAAVLVLLIGTGLILILSRNQKQETAEIKLPINQDIPAPDNNRAMITLSNGQQVYLDNVANGNLAIQGNVKVVKLANGEIAYRLENGSVQTEMVYNTLTNPRGSQVATMTLADGSKVWLNSESSLKYPVAFIGNERKVEITGEAYFEVAKNAASPFKVSMPDKGEVEVLGTHFNVNSYTDEPSINVTLLEGSVKVMGLPTTDYRLLSPGQQARITNTVDVANGVDIDEVMAWQHGYFKFNKADIKTIMRQLARWYDLDIEYRGQIAPREFGGEMERSLPLSGILRLLEKGRIHTKIEGKKLVVLP